MPVSFGRSRRQLLQQPPGPVDQPEAPWREIVEILRDEIDDVGGDRKPATSAVKRPSRANPVWRAVPDQLNMLQPQRGMERECRRVAPHIPIEQVSEGGVLVRLLNRQSGLRCRDRCPASGQDESRYKPRSE